MKEMTNAYSGFAGVYDELIKADINYDGLCDMIEQLFHKSGRKINLVADLACGTGLVTSRLAKRGYDMIGIDCSVEMLDLARKKDEQSLYLNQDITGFELYGTVDAVLCMTDGYNYITETDSLLKSLRLVRQYLNPGGVFIFDISSRFKLCELLGNNTFVYDDESVYYTWENTYEEEEELSISEITFFLREGSLYRRIDEEHIQRAWDQAFLQSMLEKCGFCKIKIFSDFGFSPVRFDSERIYFYCEKE